MTALRSSQFRRHVGVAMLLVWLFAMASSWANDCVLQIRQTHMHASAGASEPAAMIVMAAHAGAVPAHGDGATAGASVCLEVCDSASQTSAPPDRAIDLPADVLGPPISVAWTPDVAVGLTVRGAATEARPLAAVPPRTLLSRLAL
ncbi:MAG: hypothetical protein KIT17_25390 [Rubrivivax sp.]|nr:hypothetical protein [Rubrivivax sp.]